MSPTEGASMPLNNKYEQKHKHNYEMTQPTWCTLHFHFHFIDDQCLNMFQALLSLPISWDQLTTTTAHNSHQSCVRVVPSWGWTSKVCNMLSQWTSIKWKWSVHQVGCVITSLRRMVNKTLQKKNSMHIRTCMLLPVWFALLYMHLYSKHSFNMHHTTHIIQYMPIKKHVE
jgi:hypothetical protein